MYENLRAIHCCYLSVVQIKKQQNYETWSGGMDIPGTFMGIDLRTLFLTITDGRVIMVVEWRCVNRHRYNSLNNVLDLGEWAHAII